MSEEKVDWISCPECGSKEYLPVKKFVIKAKKEEETNFHVKIIFACLNRNCGNVWSERW